MTGRDLFFAIVELLGIGLISAAIAVGFVLWVGLLTAGVVLLLISLIEASR